MRVFGDPKPGPRMNRCQMWQYYYNNFGPVGEYPVGPPVGPPVSTASCLFRGYVPFGPLPNSPLNPVRFNPRGVWYQQYPQYYDPSDALMPVPMYLPVNDPWCYGGPGGYGSSGCS